MDYLCRDFPIEGATCPICHEKSWWVMKCKKCGKIFCKHCNPKAFEQEDELECVIVNCECGDSCLFI